MKVFSQLEKAQLENTTSDTGSLPEGMITYRTDQDIPKVSNGTVMKQIITEDTTQTMSNKTLAAPKVTTDLQMQNEAVLKLYEATGNGTNFMGLKAPAAVTTSTTMTLPDGPGTNGQTLVTNGVDTLSWGSAASTLATTTKTADYTATTSDSVIFATANGVVNTVITLYTAVGNAGKQITIVKKSGGFAPNFLVVIDGNGSETIAGRTTQNLISQYETVTLISDGSNWQVLSHSYPQEWNSGFIPTLNGFTLNDLVYRFRRSGNSYIYEIYLDIATVSASEARLEVFPQPQSYIGNLSGQNSICGSWASGGNNALLVGTPTVCFDSTNIDYFTFGVYSSTVPGTTARNANTIWSAGKKVFIKASLQIQGATF